MINVDEALRYHLKEGKCQEWFLREEKQKSFALNYKKSRKLALNTCQNSENYFWCNDCLVSQFTLLLSQFF